MRTRKWGLAPLPVRGKRRLSPFSLLIAAALAAGGCDQQGPRADTLHARLLDANRQVADCRQELDDRQREIDRLHRQIADLQQIAPERMALLFPVVRVELGTGTAGENDGANTGDDGIRIHLRPIDREGSAIKATGRLTVQVYDLAADPNDNLVCERTWQPAELAGKWSTALFGGHYALKLPWKAPPAHEELTVRAEFLEYLTGKRFTTQKVVNVNLR